MTGMTLTDLSDLITSWIYTNTSGAITADRLHDLLTEMTWTIPLSGATQFNITSLTSGETLIYDGVHWVNSAVTDLVTTNLSGLTDVILSAVTLYDHLMFDGSVWVNSSVTSIGGSTFEIQINSGGSFTTDSGFTYDLDKSSFVGGDNSQATGLTSFAFGDNCVANSDYSSILGGKDNSSTGTHSIVLGGKENTILHNYSAILGGSGITSVNDNTLYCEKLEILNNNYSGLILHDVINNDSYWVYVSGGTLYVSLPD